MRQAAIINSKRILPPEISSSRPGWKRHSEIIAEYRIIFAQIVQVMCRRVLSVMRNEILGIMNVLRKAMTARGSQVICVLPMKSAGVVGALKRACLVASAKRPITAIA